MPINTNTWNRLRYGLYAPVYDLVARRLVRGRQRSILLADVRPGDRVLLVGGGTGLDLDLLPPGADVTLVDLSPAMVARARDRARALGRAVRCEVMDAHRLDLPDDAFDVVLLHLVLAVVPDPEAAIREAARVLRPGGRVGIFDKFLPDDAAPSPARRLADAVATVVATSLNRRLGPLLDAAGLVRERDEPVLLGGLFRAVRAVHETDEGPILRPDHRP